MSSRVHRASREGDRRERARGPRWDFRLPARREHDVVAVDSSLYARVMDAHGALRFWFDPIVVGAEHLPREGRGIFVANHGQFGIEGVFFIEAVYRHTGRSVRSLSDRVLFKTPLVRDLCRAAGIVEGSRANASRLLADDQLVLAMPGGSREALAAERHRYRLFWPKAAGFARMAIQTGAPIVPVASIGSDDFYRELVPADANRRSALGWLVRTVVGPDRYVPPICAGLGMLPLPQQVTYLVGEPIRVDVDPSCADDDAAVAAVTQAARAATEALIARGLALRDERERATPTDLRGWMNRALRGLRAPIDVPGFSDAR